MLPSNSHANDRIRTLGPPLWLALSVLLCLSLAETARAQGGQFPDPTTRQVDYSQFDHIPDETLPPQRGTPAQQPRESYLPVDEAPAVPERRPLARDNNLLVHENNTPFITDDYFACPPMRGTGAPWVRVEYLLWAVEGSSTPPLVTTSAAGTPREEAGILGLPGTSILYGNSDLGDQARSGGRITAGCWLNCCECTGLQVSYFGLAQQESTFHANSDAIPILARPFFNVEPGLEGQDAELIAFPGLFEGNVNVNSQTSFQGAEFFVRQALSRQCCGRVDFLAGFRYAQLKDKLNINDFRTVTSGETGLAVGTTFSEFDQFATDNQFFGAELGVMGEWRRECFWIEGSLKLALGNTRSQVAINGESTATIPVPGGPTQVITTPAGLLAQSTNIGTYTTDRFAVMPELGLTAGWQFTPSLSATVGYTFMYWTDVARAGDQIDTNLNLSQLAPGGLVGIPRPAYLGVTDNVWVQGLSLGLDYRF